MLKLTVGRLRHSLAKLNMRRIARKIPLTLATMVIALAVALTTQILGHGYWSAMVNDLAWDLLAVQQGHIYLAWTGLFLAMTPLNLYAMLAVMLLTTGMLEYRHGKKLAVLGFLVIGPLASIVTDLLLWPISNAGVTYVRTALYTPDAGASTACLVCLGLLLMREKGRWRNILLPAVLLVLAGFLFQKTPYNIDHFDGYIIGLATGAIIVWWERARQARRVPALAEIDKD